MICLSHDESLPQVSPTLLESVLNTVASVGIFKEGQLDDVTALLKTPPSVPGSQIIQDLYPPLPCPALRFLSVLLSPQPLQWSVLVMWLWSCDSQAGSPARMCAGWEPRPRPREPPASPLHLHLCLSEAHPNCCTSQPPASHLSPSACSSFYLFVYNLPFFTCCMIYLLYSSFMIAVTSLEFNIE